MKIYYSALYTTYTDLFIKLLDFTSIGILESYLKLNTIYKPKFCDSFFLDSGAFSVFTRNIQIDIKEFIEFIKKNKDKIDVFSVLDVIGNPEASYKNYIIMKEAGLKDTLPCIHYGEDLNYIKKYLKYTNYLSLGGLARLSKDLRLYWLDKIFSLYPNCEEVGFHGFGIQDEQIMLRYPWKSIDASSMMTIARYGGIYSPYGVLKINSNVKYKELKWKTPKSENKIIDFCNECNIPYEKAKEQSIDGTIYRAIINIHYFEKLAKQAPKIFKNNNSTMKGFFK